MEGKVKIGFTLQNNALVDRNVYLGRPMIYTTIEFEELIAYAAKAANISESNMVVAMESIIDAFEYFLCNGHSFKIDGIGTFSLSVKTKSCAVDAETLITGADAVERVGINFLPDKSLKTLISGISYSAEALNPNNLVEDLRPFATSFESNGVNQPLFNHDEHKAFGINANTTVKVKGIILPLVFAMKVYGFNDEEELINFKVDSEKTRNVAKGLCTSLIEHVKKIELIDNGEVIDSWEWSDEEVQDAISLFYDGTRVTQGANFVKKQVRAELRGMIANVDLSVDGVQQSPIFSDVTTKAYLLNLTVGSHTLAYNDKVYTINITETLKASITTLSANGVSVPSGGSSSVIAGQTYNFIATGSNTQLVQASDIVAPAGYTVSNFEVNNGQVRFTVVAGSQAGTLKVGNYTVQLTIYEPSGDNPSISASQSAVSHGGSIAANINEARTITLTGSNLDNAEVIVSTSGTATISDVTRQANSISFKVTPKTETAETVTVKYGSTTLFRFTLTGFDPDGESSI